MLTPHSDGPAGGGVAERVGQDDGVEPRVISARLDEHQAAPLQQVVRVGVDGGAVEEPRLLLHHSLLHAVEQGEAVGALHGRVRPRTHDHILEFFCSGEEDGLENQREQKTVKTTADLLDTKTEYMTSNKRVSVSLSTITVRRLHEIPSWLWFEAMIPIKVVPKHHRGQKRTSCHQTHQTR